MNTINQSEYVQAVIPGLELSDEELQAIWISGIESEWLEVGLRWSGTLTTLECAFRHPRRLFKALAIGKIESGEVIAQTFEILRRMAHLRVPQHLRIANDAGEEETKFMMEFDIGEKNKRGLDLKDELRELTVVRAYGKGDMDGICVSDHLDLMMTIQFGKANERLFVEKMCKLFFGTAQPSLDQLSSFIRDVRNFDPLCDVNHEDEYNCQVLRSAGLIARVVD